MPTITVSALITDGEQVLLARPADEEQWALPGGVLTDADQTVEEAIVRVLADAVGLVTDEPEFLVTLYERRAAEVMVHNVFGLERGRIAVRAGSTDEARRDRLQWTPLDALADVPIAPWLVDALPALLAGEAVVGPEIDIGAMARQAGATVSPPVIIVSGPAGAGKSTVAHGLCARFPRAAHIDVDRLRDMVVSRKVSPVPGEANLFEAKRQIELGMRNAAALARNFVEVGTVTVIDDVVEQPEWLDAYLDALAGLDVRFITLLPDAETLAARDRGREPLERMGQRAEELRRIIATNGEVRGLRFDTSGWTVDQTVDIILEQLENAGVTTVFHME